MSAGVLLLAGCVTVREQGPAKVYSFSLWIPALAAASGAVMLRFGVLAIRQRWGLESRVVLPFIGPIACAIIACVSLRERTVVDGRHFEVVEGRWNVDRHDVSFDNVSAARVEEVRTWNQVEVVSYEVKTYFLVLTLKDGSEHRMLIVDTLESAWPEVVRQFRTRGIKNLPENFRDGPG
jgi:hypothetical protein